MIECPSHPIILRLGVGRHPSILIALLYLPPLNFTLAAPRSHRQSAYIRRLTPQVRALTDSLVMSSHAHRRA